MAARPIRVPRADLRGLAVSFGQAFFRPIALLNFIQPGGAAAPFAAPPLLTETSA
jgi:hypothetical protein